MAQQAVTGLAEGLPLRLRNFFARYPPQFYSAHAIGKPEPPPDAPIPHAPSPYTPSRTAKASDIDKNKYSHSKALLRSLSPEYPNPFLPHKNFVTGRWRGAAISRRRQNELVKIAVKHGVEELLPPGPKSTEYKEIRRQENGLRVKGTGIGQKVKGHKWERTLEGRLEERKKAMMEMPNMIRLWKQRGHGRGWTKWPK